MAPIISDFASELGISRQRVEKWLSLGHVRTAEEPAKGVARNWTPMEIVRLAVMARLADGGVDVAKAADIAARTFEPNIDEVMFIVAWRGFWVTAEGLSPGGPRDHWFDDQVKPAELVALFEQHEIHVAVVVRLDTIIAQVLELTQRA